MKLLAKIKALRLALYQGLYRLLPIQKNKILFWSFGFNAYSCNPKYIALELEKQHPNKYDICWVFDVSVEIPPDFPHRYVRYFSLEYMKEIATARLLVCNTRINEKRLFFRKRRGQFYIQTWHGSYGPKHIEQDAEKQLGEEYVAMAKRDSQICDLMLCSCTAFEHFCRTACWYDGEVVVTGMARTDLFFDGDDARKQQLRQKLGIPDGLQVAVYAPTFRKGLTEEQTLDFAALRRALSARFGGEWLVLRSIHPNLRHAGLTAPEGVRLMDHDVQELIDVCACLISDYSSTMIDAAIAGKPVFLFAPDLEQYRADDRGFYYDIAETPFPLCLTNEALAQSIRRFDEAAYRQAVAAYLDWMGSREDGQAARRAVELIEKVCANDESQRDRSGT